MATSKRLKPEDNEIATGTMLPNPTVSDTLCAGCGQPIRLDWIIQPSLCPFCEDKIRQTDPCWKVNRQEPGKP